MLLILMLALDDAYLYDFITDIIIIAQKCQGPVPKQICTDRHHKNTTIVVMFLSL